MTRPTRFLVRMAIFLVIVAIVAVLLFEPIERAFVANPGLNGLILSVLLIGIVYSFRQVAMLGREISWMESFRRRRPGISLQAQPRLLATIATALGEREGPVRLTAISTRALLDGVSARLDEAGQISRYLTGLLIFLGLLGTFWGLLETVASVSDVIGSLRIGTGNQANMFQDLKTGLSAPLSGMGTAFSSSLFGLAGALVLGFLDLQAGQAQNRFFNELEEWMSTVTRHASSPAISGVEGDHSVPAYIQALLEQTAESLEGLQKIVGRAEEARIGANRNLQALTERLGALTEQMQAEQTLMVQLAEQQLELQPVLRRISENVGTPALDDGTRQRIGNIEVYFARLLEDLSTGRGELMQDVRSEIKLLARTISAARDDRGPDRTQDRSQDGHHR